MKRLRILILRYKLPLLLIAVTLIAWAVAMFSVRSPNRDRDYPPSVSSLVCSQDGKTLFVGLTSKLLSRNNPKPSRVLALDVSSPRARAIESWDAEPSWPFLKLDRAGGEVYLYGPAEPKSSVIEIGKPKRVLYDTGLPPQQTIIVISPTGQEVTAHNTSGTLPFAELRLRGSSADEIATVSRVLENARVESLAISPDGKTIAAGIVRRLPKEDGGEASTSATSERYEVGLVNADLTDRASLDDLEAQPCFLGFSNDGRYIVVVFCNDTYRKTLVVFAIDTLKELYRTSKVSSTGRFAFSPDGKFMIVGTEHTDVSLLSTENWTEQTNLSWSDGKNQWSHITAITFTPDSEEVIIGNSRGEIYKWDIENSIEPQLFESVE